MKKTVKTAILIKVLIAILPLVLFGYLIEKNLVLSGTRTLAYDFQKDHPKISHLEPWQRLRPIEQENGAYFQKMHDDTIYFNVQEKDGFEKIIIEVQYKNPSANLVDLGIQTNEKEHYKKLPLESKLLDNLNWEKIETNNLTLYQKEKRFNSFEEFQENFPSDKKIIVHNANIEQIIEKDKINKENISPLRHFTTEEGVDFILTNYTTPQNNNGIITTKNSFDFSSGYKNEENNFRFQITAPGLKEKQAEIEMHQITVTFQKESISIDKLFRKTKEFFNI